MFLYDVHNMMIIFTYVQSFQKEYLHYYHLLNEMVLE